MESLDIELKSPKLIRKSKKIRIGESVFNWAGMYWCVSMQIWNLTCACANNHWKWNLNTSFHSRRRTNRAASTDKIRRHSRVQNAFSHRLGRLVPPVDFNTRNALFCHWISRIQDTGNSLRRAAIQLNTAEQATQPLWTSARKRCASLAGFKRAWMACRN